MSARPWGNDPSEAQGHQCGRYFRDDHHDWRGQYTDTVCHVYDDREGGGGIQTLHVMYTWGVWCWGITMVYRVQDKQIRDARVRCQAGVKVTEGAKQALRWPRSPAWITVSFQKYKSIDHCLPSPASHTHALPRVKHAHIHTQAEKNKHIYKKNTYTYKNINKSKHVEAQT